MLLICSHLFVVLAARRPPLLEFIFCAFLSCGFVQKTGTGIQKSATSDCFMEQWPGTWQCYTRCIDCYQVCRFCCLPSNTNNPSYTRDYRSDYFCRLWSLFGFLMHSFLVVFSLFFCLTSKRVGVTWLLKVCNAFCIVMYCSHHFRLLSSYITAVTSAKEVL